MHRLRLRGLRSAVFSVLLAVSVAAQSAPEKQRPALDPAWAGPVEAELLLRFGAASSDAASSDAASNATPLEGGAGIALRVAAEGERSAYAATTMIRLPGDAGMVLGPAQYLSFELFVAAEKPCRLLIQLDELVGEEKFRGLLVTTVRKLGAWHRVTLNLLRNELHSDSRIGSTIMPDGTPLTRFGLRLDPGRRAGVRELRLRNVRLYRQDVLAKAPVDAADEAGQTALHRAAMVGDAARALALC